MRSTPRNVGNAPHCASHGILRGQDVLQYFRSPGLEFELRLTSLISATTRGPQLFHTQLCATSDGCLCSSVHTTNQTHCRSPHFWSLQEVLSDRCFTLIFDTTYLLTEYVHMRPLQSQQSTSMTISRIHTLRIRRIESPSQIFVPTIIPFINNPSCTHQNLLFTFSCLIYHMYPLSTSLSYVTKAGANQDTYYPIPIQFTLEDFQCPKEDQKRLGG
jgi:hypothetical protein